MGLNNEFDVSALSWVKGEIDSSLAAARECLGLVQADGGQQEPLRFAQSHVHQASGALSIVGLDGVSQFAEAIDKLLSALAAGDLEVSAERLALAQRSVGMLGNYINELTAGAAHQPLRLFDAYQELVLARGGDAPRPSELFFPDLSLRPQLASAREVAPDQAAHELRVLRGRFEKGLLTWLRQPQEKAGPREMLGAVRRIEQIQALPATRAFWWAAIAFFEGLVSGAISADRSTQRVCRRIDAQMRRLLEGSQIVAERLVRDVLYFVATSGVESEHARSVREAYRLERLLPAPDLELSDTLRAPLQLRLREVLEQSKEDWNRFCAGAAVALPPFQEHIAELARRAEPLRLTQVDRLIAALGEAVVWLRADPLRLSDDLSMEIATALLVIEQAVDAPNADPERLREQVDLLAGQFHARVAGQQVGELDMAPFGDASQRAQERLFFNQLAREVQTNLGQIEQTLDGFFRNAAQRDALPGLAGPLKQVEGAFAVLGEQQAAALVRSNAARVTALASGETEPAPEVLEQIAHELSALGFYVDALKSGPAQLEHFLNPASVRLDEEIVEAAGATVEAQLVREARATHQLVEALRDAPEDSGLRDQLVSNLEAIREDAHLVADAGLEQKAREAIASIKSGAASQESLAQALADVAPAGAAPQPSQETARLLTASGEELDAELLAIFLEEAHEVLENIAVHRNKVDNEAHNFDALTTVRRGFHTLKGSSRMVGLTAFSDAARAVEMTLNRWLQLERPGDEGLIALLDAGVLAFGAWVEQLEAGAGVERDASALIAQSQALLASLDPVEPPPAPPTPPLPPAPETEPEAAAEANEQELDLSSTLLEIDLSQMASGEAPTTELDLSATDFEGNALHAFGHEFGEEAARLAEEDQARRFEAPAAEPEAPLVATEEPAAVREEAEAPAAAEDVSLAEDPLAAITLDDADLDELQIETEDEAPQELDLSATMIGGALDAIARGEPLSELDLAHTDIEGAAMLHALGQDVSLEGSALDFDFELTESDLAGLRADEVPELDIDTGPATEVLTDETLAGALDVELEALADEPPVLAEPVAAPLLPEIEEEALQVEALEALPGDDEPLPEAGFVLTPVSDDEPPLAEESLLVLEDTALEEVAIEGEEAMADTVSPLADVTARAASVSTLLPPPPFASQSDGEVHIGEQTLSRGLYDLFLAESRQLLDKLLDEHRRLESNPLRQPSIDSIRAAHTLAGISGTARIEPAYALGKALEHALHRFADVSIAPNPSQTSVMGAAILTLDGMLAEVVHQLMPAEAPEVIAQLQALQPLAPEAVELEAAPAPQAAPVLPDVGELAAAFAPVAAPLPDMPRPPVQGEGPRDELDEQLLPIFFEEAEELQGGIAAALRDMRDPEQAAEAARSLARVLHTLKGSARMAGAMRLGQYVHEIEGYLETALHAHHPAALLAEEMESGLDGVGAMLAQLHAAPAEGAGAAPAEAAEDESAGDELAPLPPPVVEAAPVARAPQAAAPAPVFLDEVAAPQQQRAPIRVRAELVDRFVNEAGEVSIARTRIEGEMRVLRRSLLDLTENVIRLRNQLREVEIQAESQMQSRLAAAEAHHDEFDPLEFDRFSRLQELTRMMAESVGDVTTIQQNILRNLDAADSALHAQGRLSRDLQQALMGVRMVPFEELSDRLYRVVRQTSKELGKRANLDIQGGAIEIDRSVLERMTAPIEHLLRNALAHGIESPQVRQATGKAEVGQITLRLTQLSNEIALEIVDDGKGLDFERILARGREAGLIEGGDAPNEQRLTQLIFEPGFSTATTVSDIAGRGVGMDVVKSETLSVGGRIEIDSRPGSGTRFLIHLPLTLAVTQALLVRSGERTFAIPSTMVEQAMELKEGALAELRHAGQIEWKGTVYPFAYLPRLLGDNQTQPQVARYQWVLLLRAGSHTLALHIDELRGNQEVVVKNAGPQFVRLAGYSGATVLPDGEISLILNPVALAANQSAPAAAGSAEVVEQAEPVARVPSVMVIDDSLTVRKITTRLLEREGFQVVTAKDGVDALEQLGDYTPDVMLCDIEMPRMDGFDLARNVRADARLKNVPIIMITSRTAEKHRNYAKEIGVNHYLGKPYQEEQLLELITGFIAEQRR